LDPGTLKGDEPLTRLSRWDSLAIMGFIAILDERFALIIPASKITACRTVADLVALTGDRVT